MKRLEFDYLLLDKIDISISNVRKTNLEEGIEELADSIKEIGVQQPIVVFFDKNLGRYKLIIGQRRYLASKRIGLKEIPAIITSVKNETDAVVKSFSENIHRLDLEYRDKMQVANELLKNLNSIKNVAKTLGVSESTVKNYLGYSAVPEEIKNMVTEKKISAGTALRITKSISDEKMAIKIAGKIKELPRNEDKIQTIEVAKDNPDKNLEEIDKIVKKRKTRQLTIDLTEQIGDALNKAVKEYNSDDKQITLEALEEWLSKRGFIK